MKKILNVVIILLTVSLFSCRKENVIVPNQIQNDNVTEAVAKNAFPTDQPFPSTFMIVGSFIMDGKDLTKNYRLYKFQLKENEITATSGLFSVNGKWIQGPKGSTISIWFNVSALPNVIAKLFKDLSGDNWMIVAETSDYIYLESFDNRIEKKLRYDIK